MTSVNRWALIWTLAASLAVTAGASTIAADSSGAQAAATEVKAAAKAEKEAKAKAEKEAKAQAKAEKKAKAQAEKEAKAQAKAVARAEATAKAKADMEAKATVEAETAVKAKADKEAKALAGAAAEAEKTAQRDKERAEQEARKVGASSYGSAPAVTPQSSATAGATPVVASGSPAAQALDPKAAKKAKRAEEKAAKAAAEQAQRDARAAKDAASGKTAEARAKKPKVAKAGAADSSAMASLARRTSDETVFHDLKLLNDLESKLAAMPATADPWRVAGARTWIEASREEYLDNDEVGFDQAAYASAAGLVAALESGAAPVTKETVPAAQVWSTSTRLRAELWDRLETLKRDEGFPCAAAELAMLEVELQWAGHEHLDTGACDSDPHLQAAQQHGLAAEALAAQCRKPEPIAVVVEVPTVPVPLPLPTAEELKVPKDVHFALNKDFVGPGSRQVIKGVANVLLKYPSVYVHLTGHTDSRGSAVYNLALSQRRVDAVYLVLRDLGIDSLRITIEFVGKSKLYAAEVSRKGYALNRRVEMDFQDSEGREIKAERTEADLQIESERQEKPIVPPSSVRPKVRIRTPRAIVPDSTRAKPAAVKSATPKPTAAKAPGTPIRTTIKTKPARHDSSMAGEDR